MCVLGGSAADMVFTDPPYTVDYQGAGKRRIANDVIGDGFGAFLQAACAAFVPVTKGAIYICMSSSEFDTLKAAFGARSEEHTSELQSLMRISYAVFCLKQKKTQTQSHIETSL